ncbi:MAG: hypothetical protein COB46_03535 [Rhodospirillaceae bacterium]|nr:MAG: hypothetical protein COB46_03535 [Rhodospirillaceae bacterium]
MGLHLTKSKYIAGRTCPRMLWHLIYNPDLFADSEPGSIQDIGTLVGQIAHQLFPGGVIVNEQAWEHEEAVRQTLSLMKDKSVPAIFEAAFEFDGVRVRVDVLERLGRGRWGLREVKSTGKFKDHHVDDLAIQLYVLTGAGVKVSSVELICINTDYTRGKRGINWQRFFQRIETTQTVNAVLDDVKKHLKALRAVVRKRHEPKVEPSSHCPSYCHRWDACRAKKPEDWIETLPNLREGLRKRLLDAGIQAIRDIPDDFGLNGNQEKVRQSWQGDPEWVSEDLAKALKPFGPPALYMDFETFNPAIPRYAGTRPFQQIPFQWSLHRLTREGRLSHKEFLADGNGDPRRAFAESLIKAVGVAKTPIIVYSSFERTQLAKLATSFPDLADDLNVIINRLADLLPITRGYIYLRDFGGSFSIKAVAPALSPDLTYDDLELVSDGGAASTTFTRLTSGMLGEYETPTVLRNALLEYCKRDTMAMVKAHKALIQRIN